MPNTDDFRSGELRAYWSVTSELRAALGAGDLNTARLCLEEIEAIGMHTSRAPLRSRCAAVLAAWHDARPTDRGIA